MTNQILAGNWKQIKGRVQEEWGRLTDDEIQQVEGHANRLLGMLQEKYGYTRREAQEQLDGFLTRIGKEFEQATDRPEIH